MTIHLMFCSGKICIFIYCMMGVSQTFLLGKMSYCSSDKGQVSCEFNPKTCITEDQLCDGLYQCPSNEDELNCKNITCPSHLFRCQDKTTCIEWHHVCDEAPDCIDESDETRVACLQLKHKNGNLCEKDQFHCLKDDLCIDSQLVCDGVADCTDASDEKKCAKLSSCELRCAINTTECIRRYQRCDRKQDCSDGSDEVNCGDAHCLSSERSCGDLNNSCVSKSSWCDSKEDCPNRADELNCMYKCEFNEYVCDSGNVCLSPSKVCDNVFDCTDKSDEGAYCNSIKNNNSTECSNQFNCRSSRRSPECIPLEQVCDYKNDCSNGNDENHFCNKTNPCEIDKGGCGLLECRNIFGKAKCFCPKGFETVSDKNKTFCKDIDECSTHWEACSQVCNNLPGSYECSCVPGYDKHNATRCIQKDHIDIYFTTMNSIRSYNTLLNSLTHRKTTIYSAKPTGLFVHENQHRRPVLFWSQNNPPRLNWGIMVSFRLITSMKFVKGKHIENPYSLTVDIKNKLIFFLDKTLHPSIKAVNMFSRVVVSLVEYPHVRQPTALVLDLGTTKRLFWIESGFHFNTSPCIMSSDRSGQDVRLWLTGGLVRPTALAVDMPNARLYWIDAGRGVIESAKLIDASDRRIISSIKKYSFSMTDDQMPTSLIIYNDDILWSDATQNGVVFKVNKFKNKNGLHKLPFNRAVYLAKVDIDQDIHQQAECASNKCSQICLPTDLLSSNQYPYMCACSEGFILDSSDKKTCRQMVNIEINNSTHQTLYKISNHFSLQSFQTTTRSNKVRYILIAVFFSLVVILITLGVIIYKCRMRKNYSFYSPNIKFSNPRFSKGEISEVKDDNNQVRTSLHKNSSQLALIIDDVTEIYSPNDTFMENCDALSENFIVDDQKSSLITE